MKKALIIGAGLGGLATALRLSTRGYQVTVLEKNATAGGRLNELYLGDFKFDLGPSFMSMTYELEELFESTRVKNPFSLLELEPLHQVFFANHPRPYRVFKDLEKLEKEFASIEPDLAAKVRRYLKTSRQLWEDTEHHVIKTNFYGPLDYLRKISRVPLKHVPYFFKSLWQETGGTFSSQEMRIIFSLIAFFLGSTPFRTPAAYSLLNYIEMQHNGYWVVEGGVYRIVEELVRILKERGVELVFNARVVEVKEKDKRAVSVKDEGGREWPADLFIANADAATFRGKVLKRPRYQEAALDRMEWGMAPFTIYLGVRGQLPHLLHHNYFLGENFSEYAKKIFTSASLPKNAYYYANVPSRSCAGYAPKNCESVFILCPAPDLRFKKSWPDKEELADNIINDMSQRIGFDLKRNTVVRKVLTPLDWESMFDLHRGSGLGLCHGINQIGILRPANKDEHLKNFYYVGASTIPGTGLPMVIISSNLVCERISHDS